MERINQFALYQLGQRLKLIASFTGDTPIAEIVFPIFEARESLNWLIKGPMSIGISRRSADAIFDCLGGILDEHFSTQEDGKKRFKWPEANAEPVPPWTWAQFNRALTTFETVFSEEMSEAAAYIVPKRGIYSTPDLVDNADKTFPAEVFGFVPEKSRIEWKAAGRCLAFNLLTSSGFHVARAVEGTMEAYYKLFCGVGGKALKSWGDYIEALERIDQGEKLLPDPKTIAELRQMKDDYRNPIMHPRVVLTEPDARMLYSNGESLIIAMAQEIAKITKAAQLALVPPGGAAAELFGENADGEGQRSLPAG